jgi:predicted DNA binding CopG/RHH family protein
MKKKIPAFRTDEEAESFVDTADLSEYDLSGFKPVRFAIDQKVAHIDLSVPQTLLDAVKTRAKARGIPFTRYIRELMQRDISRS